jgi:hypothetical protein
MIKNGWENVKVCEECGSPFNPPEAYPGEDTCEICWSLRGLPLPNKTLGRGLETALLAAAILSLCVGLWRLIDAVLL